jgi:hypothetical protein
MTDRLARLAVVAELDRDELVIHLAAQIRAATPGPGAGPGPRLAWCMSGFSAGPQPLTPLAKHGK